MNLPCSLVIPPALPLLAGIIAEEQPNSLPQLDRNPTFPLPLSLINIVVFPVPLPFATFVISEMVLVFLSSLSIPLVPPIGPLPPLG